MRAGLLALAPLLSVVALVSAAAPGRADGDGALRTIRVGTDAEFAAAVSALRDGGTILLRPHHYRELVVGDRSAAPLRIIGSPGVRIERILLERTRQVSLRSIALVPLARDARIEVRRSSGIELRDLLVTAQGTRYSASVVVPDSRGVRIRRSRFTHCGDRSPEFSNCLLLFEASSDLVLEDNRFHDCYGCDFVHGRFGSGLTVRRNRFERALPCRIGHVRCSHQDLVELFAGRWLRFEGNHFGVYRRGGAQLYLTNAVDHVRIVNNVFVGTDPQVPGYRARVALIVGSAYSRRLPRDVTIANNTILTGARRADGFAGSLRMSSRYGGLPKRVRPVVANNVIALLESRWPVCPAAREFVSNVIVRGRRCGASDVVGDPGLDAAGRPVDGTSLVVDAADAAHAPARDATGRQRDDLPDIGAFEYGAPP